VQLDEVQLELVKQATHLLGGSIHEHAHFPHGGRYSVTDRRGDWLAQTTRAAGEEIKSQRVGAALGGMASIGGGCDSTNFDSKHCLNRPPPLVRNNLS
jgi:hypothetical protein